MAQPDGGTVRTRSVLARAAIAIFLMAVAAVARPVPASAEDYGRTSVVERLCTNDTGARVAAVDALVGAVAAGQEEADWGQRLLQALAGKALHCPKDDAARIRDGDTYLDAITLAPTTPPEGRTEAPFVNLRLRAQLDSGESLLRLIADPEAGDAADAVTLIEKQPALANAAGLRRAIELQPSEALRYRLAVVQASAELRAPDPNIRLQAIARVAEAPSERTRTMLLELRADEEYARDPQIGAVLDRSIASVETWLMIGQACSILYSGLSYASILFMAALGLAVIFGLMGVINLAQGELIMIGAYATYVVQEIVRFVAPGLIDWYMLFAIPVTFLSTAAVGLVMEATVIRFLYRRPLMTLLATWAISLLLVNGVRVIFGTQNLEFVSPAFLSGGVRLVADFIVTWNRLFAIGFAVAVMIAAVLVLRRTTLGLYIRAVTENRNMAGCVGVSTRRVDMMSFGIGSGLAGLAGLALSPIYNVNPDMGTNFIVDAFMVVVLGGVGSLFGTLLAAVSIGQINVMIEPLYGAVAAKVIVLLLIIAFIQFRPQGIFAAKGRR